MTASRALQFQVWQTLPAAEPGINSSDVQQRLLPLQRSPRSVKFALADGASDLVGLKRVLVTADMIGGVVAIFCAGEVKRPKVKVPEHQRNFVDFVNAFGGIAGVVRSPDDAVDLFGARVLAGGAP